MELLTSRCLDVVSSSTLTQCFARPLVSAEYLGAEKVIPAMDPNRNILMTAILIQQAAISACVQSGS